MIAIRRAPDNSKMKPLIQRALAPVKAFAVSVGIGFASIPLLSVTVGIPSGGPGSSLRSARRPCSVGLA